MQGDNSHVSFLLVVFGCLTGSVAQSSSNVVFEVLEEQKSDTFVGNVAHASKIQSEVTPADFQNLRYQILSSDGLRIASMFTINIRSGMLYTNAMIDREQVCDSTIVTCTLQFDVTVQLDVAVIKILHIVVIIHDINDNAPSFPVRVLRQNISEASPRESDFSIPSAADRDSQSGTAITYWIENNQVFGLKEEKLLGVSLLKVVLLQELDREKQSEYLLYIYAKDGNTSAALTGTLSVIITVMDSNDNSPQFSESVFNLTVSEDAEIGAWVGTINATDLDIGDNGRISFQYSSFTSSRVRQLFDLNPDTGHITVKANLEYESGETFQAVIVAIDHGGSPKASQGILIINIIDVGNTPPKLSLILVDPLNQNSTVLSEALPVDWFIGTVRYQDNDQGDNGKVNCTSLNNHFALDSLEESGYAIKIKTSLDRETENEVLVVLKCSDHGTPSLSAFVNFTVRVSDVNDNRPVFTEIEYRIIVSEGNSSLQNILQVSANDADEGANRELTYQLTTNSSKAFSIDPITGYISLLSPLDRETDPILLLNIEAVDKGQSPLTGSSTVSIIVKDINDNTPEITRTTYQVKENQEPGTFVAQVAAVDNDDGINAQLNFKLLHDPSRGFQVTDDGIITTKQSMDRETVDRYFIVISVRDMGTPSRSSSSTLTIDITDTNDHYPQIMYPRPGNDTVNLSAGLSPGMFITKINATDSDLDKNSKLVYLIVEGNKQMFGIDNATGSIFLTKRLSSNRDTSYRLTISVSDSGNPRLHNNTFLLINVDFANVTWVDAASDMEQQYVIIAGVIAGVTVVIAVIVITIIIKLKRDDQNRCLESRLKSKNMNLGRCEAKIVSEANILEVGKFKVDSMINKGDENVKDNGRGTNAQCDSNMTNGSVPMSESYRPPLTRELLDGENGGQFQLLLEGRHRLTSEDIHSDASTEATTSDSGRGASDGDDASSGASLTPSNHPEVTISNFTASRIPSTDTCLMLPSNEISNMALSFLPDSSSSDLSRSPADLCSQNSTEKIRRAPSKVRFSIDDHGFRNRRIDRSPISFDFQSSNVRNPHYQVTPHDIHRGHRAATPRQDGGQFLSNHNSSMSTYNDISNIPDFRHDSTGQRFVLANVPLSVDALAKHNLLQNGSIQQHHVSSNNRFHVPHLSPNYQPGVGTQHFDEEDDNISTTTSGSYIVDDTFSTSVEC